MKRIFLFIFVFLILGVALVAESNELVGVWKLGNLTITFKKDKTYTWKVGNKTPITGKYKVEGTFLTMYYNGKPSQYLFMIKGNSLRLTDAKGNVINLKRSYEGGGGSNSTSIEKLYGTWEINRIRLIFYRSGKYVFGSSEGSFRATSDKIIMRDSKAGRNVSYDYLLRGDVLKLRDSSGNVIALHRVSSASESSGSALIGKWVFRNNPNIFVAFYPNGNYTFATDSGKYRSDSSKIYFTSYKSKKTVAYDYRISGNTLLLRDSNGNVMAFIKK